jgi:NADPH:quinone reductase-like Zn-dependent oxidoreductase
VGSIVCQWAKHLRATVIGTVGTAEKADRVRTLGCDHPIQYTQEDFAARVKEITGGKGFDIVAQTAAYIDPTVEEYMNLATELTRPMGVLIFQGDFLHQVTLKDIHRWHHQSMDIRSLGWRHYTHQFIEMWSPDCMRVMQHNLVDVRSLITATFPLDKITEAFKTANEDPDQLKVVIKP